MLIWDCNPTGGWPKFKNNLKYFFMFSDRFDVLMSKINFINKKKYYFDTFLNENHFEKQPLPHSQTPP